jgi:hypothetical protein
MHRLGVEQEHRQPLVFLDSADVSENYYRMN